MKKSSKAGPKLVWNGELFKLRVHKHCRKLLDEASDFVVEYMKELVSTVDRDPSSPGEPPHKCTGRLQEAISWDAPSPMVRRVGLGLGGAPAAPHGLYLEFGTRNMLPRPWLRRSISETAGVVSAVLTRKMQ